MLKAVLFALLSLLLLPLGAIVFFPEIFVNKATVSWTLKLIDKDEGALGAINQGDWQLRSSGFLSYDFQYKNSKLCLEELELNSCIEDFDLQLKIQPFAKRSKPLTLSLLKAQLKGGQYKVTEGNAAPNAQENPLDPLDIVTTIKNIINRTELNQVNLLVSDFQLHTPDKTIAIENMSVTKKLQENLLSTTLRAKLGPTDEIKVMIELPWSVDQKTFIAEIKLEADAQIDGQKIRIVRKVDADSIRRNASFDYNYSNKKSGIKASGVFAVDWVNELNFSLESSKITQTQSDYIAPEISTKDCRFSLSAPSAPETVIQSLWGSVLKGSCTLKSKIAKGKQDPWEKDFLLEDLSVELLSEIHFSKEFDVKGSLNLKSSPFSEKLCIGEVAADLSFEKTRNSALKLGDAQLSGHLKLLSFKTIASILNQYAMIIPAPFHVLDGKVDIEIEGSFVWDSMNLDSKIQATTELSSENQKLSALLKAKLTGEFLDKKLLKVEADLNLLDSQIQLPEFNVKQAASPFKDPRLTIERKSKQKPNALVVQSVLRIQTKKPLKIRNPDPAFTMPIRLDLKKGFDKKLEGTVRVDSFETELFNRKITVKEFSVTLPSRKLTGLLTTRALDYDVSLLLSGKPDSIKLTFQSSPPLERRQIITLLLFNDPFIAAEEDKSASAGHFDIAAAQGVLSLASFYILGNSRLESFKYNPTSDSVTARLRLNSGSSVELIAGDEGVEGVGYIRRIGRNWRVRTMGKEAGTRQSQSGQALIEWFKYFD